MASDGDTRQLNRLERALLGLLVVAVVGFGVVVELRSALQKHRRTDFGVYARAGWAARQGLDPYAIEDDRGWHFCYPAPFAVLLAPLADPPAGESRSLCLPFAVSVAVWYLLGVACAAFAVDRFARAALPGEPRWSRRWWYARTGPFLVALGAVGHTLARGQVNLLVVACVAAAFGALADRRSFAAGVWIGAAAALKAIPGFLALYFLAKRDIRGLVGVAGALLVGLLLVPAVVWGPGEAIELNRKFLALVLLPGATGNGDTTRGGELTNANATDSQSIQAVIHNWLHPFASNRPAVAAPLTRFAHWMLGGLATLAILAAARRRPSTPANNLLLLGALAVVMLHLSPVSHMHYLVYALPLVCGVWLKGLMESPDNVRPTGLTFAALVTWGLLTAAPLFDAPWADALRFHGGALAASYLLLRVAFGRPGRLGWYPPRPSELTSKMRETYGLAKVETVSRAS
jgi:alpha-1,2-mannosyltransferase